MQSQLITSLNDQISHFQGEWIDTVITPQKLSIPSDISLGLDDLNFGSKHSIQQRNQFICDSSINYGIIQRSGLGNRQSAVDQSFHLLGQELDMLNMSKNDIYLRSNNFIQQKGDNHHLQQGLILDEEDTMFKQDQLINQKKSSQQIQSVEHTDNIDHKQESHKNKQQQLDPVVDNQIQQRQNWQQQIEQPRMCTIQQLHQQPGRAQHNQQVPIQTLTQSCQVSQQTITINQSSFASHIFQCHPSNNFTNSSNKNFNLFLQTNTLTYRTFYQSLQKLYGQAKKISQRSVDNFMMYNDFFSEKAKQYYKYLQQVLKPETNKLYQSLAQKDINNLVYVDTKIVLRDIYQRNISKAKLYKQFWKCLQSISKDLKQVISKIYQTRKSTQKTIFTCLTQIKQLQSQLSQLISYRISYQQNIPSYQTFKTIFKVDNVHLFKDQYLQIKFMIEKQVAYIFNMKKLHRQVVKYLNSIFLNDQLIISVKIKEYLINYTQALIYIQNKQAKIDQIKHKDQTIINKNTDQRENTDKIDNKNNNQYHINNNQNSINNNKQNHTHKYVLQQNLNQLTKKKDQLTSKKIQNQLRISLGKKLYSCLDQFMLKQLDLVDFQIQQQNPNQLLQIINDHYQNQVFLNHLQMDQRFIFYQCQGIWLSRDQFKNNSEKSLKQTSEKSLKPQPFCKKQQMSLQKPQMAIQKPQMAQQKPCTQNQIIRLTLTIDKYLHLQKVDKIATMKLNEIKISKKGQYLIISDKGKGIVGYLVNNGNQLGRIEMNSNQQADLLATKIRQLIQRKSNQLIG